MIKKNLTIFILYSLLLTISFNVFASELNGIIEVDSDDTQMNQAIKDARASINEFFQAQSQAQKDVNADLESFGMKVFIVNPMTNEGEHIWLSDIQQVGDEIEGSIANEPAYVTHLSLGQRYRFKVGDVSDWAYVSNGQMKGNFTMCAQFKYMQPEEIEYYVQNYGIECQ